MRTQQVTVRKLLAGALAASVCLFGAAGSAAANPPAGTGKAGDHPKLDRALNDRAAIGGGGTSRVIVMLNPSADASSDYKNLGAKLGRKLGVINGEAISLSNGQLKKLADSPAVASMHWDRPTGGKLNRAAVSL